MNATRTTARPALRWLLALLLGGTAALALSSTASAVDNTLASSSPAPESTVEFAPASLSLQFANTLGTTNTVSMTCGPDGGDASPMSLGSPVLLADQVTLTVSINQAIGKGVCNVLWQVTDTNLQPAGSGTFRFSIANDPAPTTSTIPTTTIAGAVDTGPTTTVATTTPITTSSADGTTDSSNGPGTDGPLGLFRWLTYLGLAVMFGSFVVIAVAWPEGVEYILTVRFLRTAWTLTLVASYLFAAALAADISGDSLGKTLVPTGWSSLLDTTPGTAALLCVLLVAGAAYTIMRPERIIDPSTQLAALGPTALAVVTLAFSREDFGILEWGLGAVHGLAMAVWLGGLVLLTRVVLAGPGDEDLVHAVRGFSRISTPAMWITVLSGAALAFDLDRGDLGSSHGLVLVVKTLLVALMVFIAVAARQFIAQRVARANSMTMPIAVRLRRVLGLETVVGIVVLALSAWLVALSPPGLAGGSSSDLDLGPNHRFINPALSAEVLVAFSETVGPNDVRIEVVEPPANLSGLVVEFIPPPGSAAAGMAVEPIPLTGPGVAVLPKDAGFTLNASGTWTVIVRIGTNEVARTDVFVSGDDGASAPGST